MAFTVPATNAVDQEAASKEAASDVFDNSELEQELIIQRSDISGLVLIPGFRFDGDSDAPPWNSPEGKIFDWLTQADIQLDDDQFGHVEQGELTAMALRWDDVPNGLMVKFANLGKGSTIETWGNEFMLEGPSSLAAREVAAYEMVKAMGGEDLALPICIRDLDPTMILTDEIRQSIAKKLKIA